MALVQENADDDTRRPTEKSQAKDETERRKRSGQSAAAARIAHQQSWVDQQIRVAMARGDFDNLPGAGKPIKDLDGPHDPDWWLKRLVEREQISVLPPALQLRKEDAELDAHLDSFSTEGDVRREVEDFNARVMKARYDPTPGPPLITMPREVDAEVAAWRARRVARRVARRERWRVETAVRSQAQIDGEKSRPTRRWWRRTR